MPSVPSKNKGGDCFESAANYVIDNSIFKKNEKLILVHGEVAGQGELEGIRFGHAWVEKGSTVIEVANGKHLELPKVLYYALGQVSKTYKYTPERLREMLLKHETYGPWELRTEL